MSRLDVDTSTLPLSFQGKKSGVEITIRHARVNDAPRIIGFLQIIGGETDNLTFGAGEFLLTEEQERAYLKGVLESDTSIFLLAEIGGNIVSTLNFSTSPKARIEHIGEFGVSVLRRHWGEGIGEVMTRTLIDWAMRHDVVAKLVLEVRVDNERAVALYERLGFEHEGRNSMSMKIDGAYVDTYWMGMKTLNASQTS